MTSSNLERLARAGELRYFQVDESLLEELIVATAQLTRHMAAAALESRQSPPPDNSGA